MVRSLSLLFILLLFWGCSVASRREQNSLVKLYKGKNFEAAEQLLKNSSLKKERENRLLYFLERGKISFSQGFYTEAEGFFHQADRLLDAIYTKRIRDAVSAYVANDNSLPYEGSIFERSMLYYYRALNFVLLSQRGIRKLRVEKVIKNEKTGESEKKVVVEKKEISKKNQRNLIYSARAILVAWDSFFQSVHRSSRINTFHSQDLLAKIFAAQIHEMIGGRGDLQIAKQLYRDALKILQTSAKMYGSFNTQSEAFFKAFKEGERAKLKNLFLPTKQLKRVKEYLENRVSLVGKKKGGGTTLVLEEGVISPMKPDKFSFTLNSAFEKIENPGAKAFVRAVGLPILTYFAMGPLGLGFVSRHGNSYIFTQHNAGMALTKEAGIEFEMPMVEKPKPLPLRDLKITQQGKVIETKPLILAAPLGDIAHLAAIERAINSYARVGLRVALKHVLAIVAAYKTYTAVKSSSGELFAKPAALAQYVISSKGILETEKADIRYWATLPQDIFIQKLNLKPGEYMFHIGKRSQKVFLQKNQDVIYLSR